MKDFAAGLDERLQQLAIASSAAPADRTHAASILGGHATLGRNRRRHLPRPRQVAASGVGGLMIAAASATLLTGSSAADLPVFKTPMSDARGLIHHLDLGAPIDFSQAHVIRSRSGTAAIVTADGGERTCLAIPDPDGGAGTGGPGGAMGSCQDTAAVERTGFLVQSIPVQPEGAPRPRAAVAFILPVGARNARIFDGVEDRAVTVLSGVALAYTRGAARLRYELGGRTVTLPIAGPFPEGKATCPDGHEYTPTIVPGSDGHGSPGYLDVRKLCAGHGGDDADGDGTGRA